MTSAVIPFPGMQKLPPEFAIGDCVALDDGRDGFVRRRQFRHDRPEPEFYDVALTGGHGSVWVRPQRLRPFFAGAAR